MMPNAASARFQRPLNASATHKKVVLAGNLNADWHPYRATTALMPQVCLVEHCWGEHCRRGSTPSAFVDRLAACATHLTSGMLLNYAVTKIFEIPATGQLLLVNQEMRPILRWLWLVEGKHFLTYNYSNLAQVLQYVTSSADGPRAHVERMRAQGQQLVMKHHTTSKRAEQIDAFVRCLAHKGAARSASSAVSHCAPWHLGPAIAVNHPVGWPRSIVVPRERLRGTCPDRQQPFSNRTRVQKLSSALEKLVETSGGKWNPEQAWQVESSQPREGSGDSRPWSPDAVTYL